MLILRLLSSHSTCAQRNNIYESPTKNRRPVVLANTSHAIGGTNPSRNKWRDLVCSMRSNIQNTDKNRTYSNIENAPDSVPVKNISQPAATLIIENTAHRSPSNLFKQRLECRAKNLRAPPRSVRVKV